MNPKELEKLSMEYRGRIIHETIWLEKNIDVYIARYFCGEDERKVAEMHLFFFGENRTTFGGKCEVFKHIAETYDNKWYKEYPSLKASMYKDLEYIISERNIVAHRLLDTSPETLKQHGENVIFKRFNLKYKYEVYTEDKYRGLVLMIKKLILYLNIRLFPEILAL